MGFPVGSELSEVIDGFKEKWGIIQCAGAIDGSHIPVSAPAGNHIDNNPHVHAQRGLQYLVCVSVCLSLSVYDYSRTTGYEVAYERYQQLQCYKGKKINVAIFLKRLRSRDMA